MGSAKLSKGGSGDVLSGLIVSLLAQGYTAIGCNNTRFFGPGDCFK